MLTDSIAAEGKQQQQPRKKRPRRKKKSHQQVEKKVSIDAAEADSMMEDVEVEYITRPEFDILTDPQYASFAKVFERFELRNPDLDADQSVPAPDEDGTEHRSGNEGGDGEGGGEEEGESDGQDKPLSKKKMRLMNRLSVAELKQLVKKPEVVEWVDVTATNPRLLVHLKAYKNTVPVPIHWSQKRKYLQGKRGIEKPPFELPNFIKDTGIMEMRQAVKEKEDHQKLKTKARERMQPKMGKLDIDYQKLHDAFFRFQTKPKMTGFGEMYYEGKEFETQLREKRPGLLSEELKAALNIPPLAPPPWLINMQRFGPPPSYPNLKIPGLNAPIPEGAQWGYHPGGWGKPPVDEFNRPLYGDVFGYATKEYPRYQMIPVDRILWGELEVENVSSSEDEEESDEDEEMTQADLEENAVLASEMSGDLKEGLITPSGISSVPSGLETPEHIELRKEVRKREIVPIAIPPTMIDQPKQLYQILHSKDSKITGFMGSQHVYDIKSRKPTEAVEVSLNPEEVEEGINSTLVQAKYEDAEKSDTTIPGSVAAAGGGGGGKREDQSKLVKEHEMKQTSKREKLKEIKEAKEASQTAGKKYKDFKF